MTIVESLDQAEMACIELFPAHAEALRERCVMPALRRLAPVRLSRKQNRTTTFSLRKEVIQPQVLLRLPCYDFTPIMNYTLDGCPPCGSAHRLLVQPTFVM